MKYLLMLVVILGLQGCGLEPPEKQGLPSSIGMFTDGSIVCYTYYNHSISCVQVCEKISPQNE